jgi:hypothetical protein
MERRSVRRPLTAALLVASAALWACSGGTGKNGHPPIPPGTGGNSDTGGSPATGGSPGTGGSTATGGSTGTGGEGTGGATTPDASVADSAPTGDDGGGGVSDASVGPTAPGQGPVAEGKVVFSQDFEQNMNGFSRSPNGLPADRVQIVDDPAHQRGKVVRIHFEQGDNFRTSAGTQPRSWFSSADGYSAKANSVVSVAWGFMWENTSMGAHFAQIIREGGPLWMMDVDVDGVAHGDVHAGNGKTGPITKIEANKWYDFRVDTDYKAGGAIKFFLNGKLVGQGTGAGGSAGRFDCGIYWYKGPQVSRTVYLSNLSIAEQ